MPARCEPPERDTHRRDACVRVSQSDAAILEGSCEFSVLSQNGRGASEKNLDQLVPSRAARRLRAFRRDVDKALAGKVTDIVLFGSRARGDASANSDYDVAVFVRNPGNRRMLDHMLADIAYPHILEGVHIRPVSVPDNLLDNPDHSNLAVSILRDGVTIP